MRAIGRAPSVTAWSLTRNDHKHTDTGHPLPDFSLQNTCKFAIPSAAWITALTTGARQKDASVLTHLFPLVLWSAACNIHTPSDLVVDHWTSDVENGSPLDFLL